MQQQKRQDKSDLCVKPSAATGANRAASIPTPGGRSLHPVKNRGGGSFVRSVDQNFLLFFTGHP